MQATVRAAIEINRSLSQRSPLPRDFGGSAPGANLADADATVQVSEGVLRRLPAATLGAARVLTLGTTNAVKGDQICIVRDDVTANTYTVHNGGPGANDLLVMPASKQGFCLAQFDGTNWFVRACSPN